MGRLRIIGKEADLMHYETAEREEELTWRKGNAEEIEKASALFSKYFMKGWIAYTVTPERRKIQVFAFNPEFEEIVLVPIVSGG